MNKWRRFPFNDTEQFWSQWDHLNGLYNQSNPMLDSVFVRALVKYFPEDIEVLSCQQSDELIALLLVQKNRWGITQVFAPSQARIALCLIPSTVKLPALLSALRWRHLRLDCLFIDPLFQRSMLDSLSFSDATVSSINMDVSIEGSFEQYWSERSKSLRKGFKRYLNKIDDKFDHFQFRVIDQQSAVKQAVVDYGVLESSGWKSKRGTALHPSNTQGRFYQEIMADFSAIGQAIVFEIRLGDQLVASRLCIFNADRMIILKTTYDERLKEYAFGRVLLYKLIAYLFEKKITKRLDFYTNATQDQLRWATEQRTQYHVSLYSSVLGRFCFKPLVNLKSKYARDESKLEKIELVFCNHINELSEQEQKLFEFASTPFTSFDWVENFAENVADRLGRVVFLSLKIDARSEAILPLIEKQEHGVKVLSCFSNYYTPYIGLICDKAKSNDYFQLILENGHQYFSRFDKIDILPIAPSQLETISPALKRIGFVEDRYQFSKNWRELGIQSYEQFVEKISSSLRSTIKRKKKKLTPEAGYEVKEITADNAEQLIIDYQRVYEKSWKVNEPFPRFIEQLMRRGQRSGQSRLYVMYHLTKPVAAQFWIVNGHRAYIYKLAYDPEYRNLSVGTVLSDYIFHDVITRDGVDEIDYLVGDDSYKSDWMSDCRSLYGICAYNKKSALGWFFIVRKMIKDLILGRWQNRTGYL